MELLVTRHNITGWRAVPARAKCFAALVLAAAAVHGAVAAEQPVRAGSQAGVIIENAWVRAMPPSQPNTAAYLTVRNEGETRLQIVGATSEPHARVEIHTSREVDGMVSMARLQEVILEPGQSVQFAPGGMHLMMLGLNKMPAPGEQVKLCLVFDSGASACTNAEVRRVAPSPDDQLHQNHQHH